jgi:DNA-binding response OmpR family regulator
MTLAPRPIDVLAVDDDPTTRAVISVLMRKYGLAAATCAHGGEMWAALDQHQPRVIVLDVEMPGDDGFVLAEELRRRYGLGIAIIMLTSHGLPGDLAVAMTAGADDYLTKPCDWRRLLSLVQGHLAGAMTSIP